MIKKFLFIKLKQGLFLTDSLKAEIDIPNTSNVIRRKETNIHFEFSLHLLLLFVTFASLWFHQGETI